MKEPRRSRPLSFNFKHLQQRFLVRGVTTYEIYGTWSTTRTNLIIMNHIIQNQLDRVDTALNTLTTSIESYNPSIPAAIDLLAADDELQKSVKLRKHQSSMYVDCSYLISTEWHNIKPTAHAFSNFVQKSKTMSSKPNPNSLYLPKFVKSSSQHQLLHFQKTHATCPSLNSWSMRRT